MSFLDIFAWLVLPAGSTALAAIFTDRVKASHVIRKVVLRQTAILNDVYPF
jgi:hypothetical protein